MRQWLQNKIGMAAHNAPPARISALAGCITHWLKGNQSIWTGDHRRDVFSLTWLSKKDTEMNLCFITPSRPWYLSDQATHKKNIYTHNGPVNFLRYTTIQMIGGGKIFKMLFKEVSYSHQGCLLDKKYSKTVILWNSNTISN